MGRLAFNEQIVGYDSNGNACIVAHFVCDSETDLPPQNAYTGNVLMIGCTAHCIEEQTNHEMKSDGTWKQV